MSVKILIFAEGDFERVETRPTVAEAIAYADGVRDGAGLYGSGGCGAYVMPVDEADMREAETARAIELALAAFEKADATP